MDTLAVTTRFDLTDAQWARLEPLLPALAELLLACMLPLRRARISARKVKCVLSRYAGRPQEEGPAASARVAGIDIRLQAPGTAPSPVPSPAARAKIMTPGSRVDRVFALLSAQPDRAMTPSELARLLVVTNVNSFSAFNWPPELGVDYSANPDAAATRYPPNSRTPDR